MKKKLLAILAAAVLAAGLLPGTAFAADSDFTIENGVLTKYNGPGGAVTIPDGVTAIGDSVFYGCASLTGVTIPDSVTAVGVSAFRDCEGLTDVTIPNGVTSIGNWAFMGCKSLTDVSVPDSATSIGLWAFSGTPWQMNLGEFAVVNGILLAYQGNGGDVVIPDTVTAIGELSFQGCNTLTSVTIPDSVTRIGGSAFSDCMGLKSVTIPSGVTAIEDHVFSKCVRLTSVRIPDGVTSIGYCAFWDCSGLTELTIPSSVTAIDSSAFYACSSLTDIYYGGNESQWEQISIDSAYYDGNAPLFSANIHFNSAAPAFSDVPDWCAAEASWGAEQGIVLGVGGGLFGTLNECTNVEILTFLWRAAGRPSAAQAPVTAEPYIQDFQDAVNWAYAQDMIDDAFASGAPCTRSSAVMYIWQALGSKSAPASSFSDVPAGSAYAGAVNWAVANGVTKGTGDGTAFSPDNTCTRGEIVTFLYRAYA